MSKYRAGLEKRLGNPAPREPRFRVEWPTKDNTDPHWWKEHGKSIKREDWNIWCLLDLFLKRDPDVTGSRWWLDRLTPSGKGWSINQEILACVALMMRDDDPTEYVALMRAMVGDKKRDGIRGAGIMAVSEKRCEQYARYLRFYGAAAAVALSWINERLNGDKDQKFANARRLTLWFLEHVYFWLDSCDFGEFVITGGFRRQFVPEELDELHLDVMQNHDGGELEARFDQMDTRPGNYMNGGVPRDFGERLMLDAREDGLLVACDKNCDPTPPTDDGRCHLRKIKTREPFPMTVEPLSDGILVYFERIHWRPGGDILVAAEMHRGWKSPTLWFWPEKKPIPGEWWGFDRAEKAVVEKRPR